MAPLFEKLCQQNTLYDAWYLVKSKKSAGGIDGMSVADFDADARQHIPDLASELKSRAWTP